jgi:D-glycero-D-manno-heptose 1,7-bisphosphate phosphatase
MKRPAMFLDRDGVLNRAVVRDGIPRPPASPAELEILPGVGDALNALKAAGYTLIVVTNQPDVARGTTPRRIVDEIHARLAETLPLDAILACFHDDSDGCECRKPKPGLLLQAAHEWTLDLASSFMVGDRWRDVEAGRRAGCRTFYIEQDYPEKAPSAPDFRVASLPAAARVVLALRSST